MSNDDAERADKGPPPGAPFEKSYTKQALTNAVDTAKTRRPKFRDAVEEVLRGTGSAQLHESITLNDKRIFVRLIVEPENTEAELKGPVPAELLEQTAERVAELLQPRLPPLLDNCLKPLFDRVEGVEKALDITDRPDAAGKVAGTVTDRLKPLLDSVPRVEKALRGTTNEIAKLSEQSAQASEKGARHVDSAVRHWAVILLAVHVGFPLLILFVVWVANSWRSATAPPPGVPDDLAEQVAAKVKAPRPDTDTPRKLDDILKRLAAPGAAPPAAAVTLTPADRDQLLDGLKAALPKTLALSPADQKALLDGLKAALPKAGAGEPTDVLLVVCHGATMDAGDYLPALRKAVVTRPRGKDQPTRVGLALGQGETLAVLVPVDAAEARLDILPKANIDVREQPALLAGAAKKALPPDRGRRRGVLVVSADTEPVGDPAPGWSDLTDVHVVVVARRAVGPADQERLARWFGFAELTRGTVQLVRHPGNADRQNAALDACLARLIDPAR